MPTTRGSHEPGAVVVGLRVTMGQGITVLLREQQNKQYIPVATAFFYTICNHYTQLFQQYLTQVCCIWYHFVNIIFVRGKWGVVGTPPSTTCHLPLHPCPHYSTRCILYDVKYGNQFSCMDKLKIWSIICSQKKNILHAAI